MNSSNACLISDREQSPLGEAIRALRSRILALQAAGSYKSLLFAGIGTGRGAAAAAANTAVSLAYSGRRVVIVDADVRQPRLHSLFGLALHTGGLSDVIQGRRKLTEVLRPSGIARLSVLTCGSGYAGQPVELLAEARSRFVFAQLREQADYVLVTGSAMQFSTDVVVSDACVLASRVDGVIVVIDARQVEVSVAQQAVNLLKGSRGNLVGVVMNEVQDGQARYYHKKWNQ